MKHLKLGVVGWKNYARHVIDVIKTFQNVEIDSVYHPLYVPDIENGTDNFDKLLRSDGIFVLSPDATHFSYVESLLAAGYNNPIFCEKPPVINNEQLQKLIFLNPKNVFYDFCLRHSEFYRLLVDMSKQIDKIISATVFVSHGLAYKPGYATTWRSDAAKNARGLLDTVAVHWIDMLASLISPVSSMLHVKSNVSNNGTACDTSVISLQHAEGQQSFITASYAAPALLKFTMLGSNGFIEFNGETLTLNHPRDTYNARGMFITPPAVEIRHVKQPFEDGLQNAVRIFLEACRTNAGFPEQLFIDSIRTMQIMNR
jgi:predicted dehydrogenase